MMRSSLLLFGSIALTILCWGMYGPVLQWGQLGMSTVPGHPALLRPFVCVGLAYFLIGVIVPSVWLYLYGEKGEWTVNGIDLEHRRWCAGSDRGAGNHHGV